MKVLDKLPETSVIALNVDSAFAGSNIALLNILGENYEEWKRTIDPVQRKRNPNGMKMNFMLQALESAGTDYTTVKPHSSSPAEQRRINALPPSLEPKDTLHHRAVVALAAAKNLTPNLIVTADQRNDTRKRKPKEPINITGETRPDNLQAVEEAYELVAANAGLTALYNAALAHANGRTTEHEQEEARIRNRQKGKSKADSFKH